MDKFLTHKVLTFQTCHADLIPLRRLQRQTGFRVFYSQLRFQVSLSCETSKVMANKNTISRKINFVLCTSFHQCKVFIYRTPLEMERKS